MGRFGYIGMGRLKGLPYGYGVVENEGCNLEYNRLVPCGRFAETFGVEGCEGSGGVVGWEIAL